MFNIREIRKKKGIGQQELAERCGISRQTISAIETGKQKDMMMSNLEKIAVALGVTPVELISGKGA